MYNLKNKLENITKRKSLTDKESKLVVTRGWRKGERQNRGSRSRYNNYYA